MIFSADRSLFRTTYRFVRSGHGENDECVASVTRSLPTEPDSEAASFFFVVYEKIQKLRVYLCYPFGITSLFFFSAALRVTGTPLRECNSSREKFSGKSTYTNTQGENGKKETFLILPGVRRDSECDCADAVGRFRQHVRFNGFYFPVKRSSFRPRSDGRDGR